MKAGLLDNPIARLTIIVLLGLLAYSNTLDAPFALDDMPDIVANPLIKDVSNIPSFFAGAKGHWASRPLLHASVALNYHFGGLDTTGYHIVNIAIHLINGVLLYLLVAMTGRHLDYDEKTVKAGAALASAIFVLHPLQTEAVNNIVNRSVLFATAFYLLGIVLFLKAVTVKKRGTLFAGGLFVVSLLGMGSREDFATFPLMLFIYDLFFISRFKFREALKHHRAYLPVMLSAIYLVYLIAYNTYTRDADFPGQGIPSFDYALTQFNIHATYLRLLLLPVNQNLEYDYPTARTLFELPTLLSGLGYICLWAVGLYLARKRPIAAFPLLWFLVTLLPISFVVAFTGLLLDDAIFEHRAYLPSAGILMASAVGIVMLVKSIDRKTARLAAMLMIFLVPAALASATYARNGVWRNEISLWEDVVKKSPGKARPHNNLGIAYKTSGNLEKAVEHYKSAIEADPYYANAYSNLGNVYVALGLFDKAIKNYEAAQFLRPSHPDAYYNMGLAYHSQGLHDKAIRYYLLTLGVDPNFHSAHFNLGSIYLERGLTDEARKEYEAGLQSDPNNAKARKNLEYINNLK